jgi:DNA-binding response OmpR family regulator
VQSEPPSILLVEDEDTLREAYSRILGERYDVSTAATGQAAIDAMSDAIDIVLLDRRLPDMGGDDVLREIQARNYDCYVAMVTAVDPDFDIIEMGIDDYLVKPLSSDGLQDAIERLLSLAEYDSLYRELSQKRVKRNILAQERSPAELHGSEEFDRLQSEITTLENELEDVVCECDDLKRELEL